MSMFSATALTDLAGSPHPWAAALGAPDAAPLRDQVEAALMACPDAVREPIRRALIDRYRANWGRAALQAIALAGTQGHVAVSWLDEQLLAFDGPDGRFHLAVLDFEAEENPVGHPDDVARLRAMLETTFGSRRYSLYLRRGIPRDFDPKPVARAVHLWLSAIDRGEWAGQHAIYEDDLVAIELTLLSKTGGDDNSCVLSVGPIDALERLAKVDPQVVEQCRQHEDAHRGVPLVVVLAGTGPWRVTRGYAEQLLYGTAEWTETGGELPYISSFKNSGRSLFGDPSCRSLGGLWWVEPVKGGLEMRSWVHENPWCQGVIPSSPGSTFRRLGDDSVVSGAIRMAWSGPWQTEWARP